MSENENQSLGPSIGGLNANPMNYFGRQAAQPGPAPHNRVTVQWLYQWVGGLTHIVMAVMALPAEVVLRRRFGERYLDWPMVALAYIYTLFFASIAEEAAGAKTQVNGVLVANVFLVITLFHMLEIKYSSLCGEERHSFSPGKSLPPMVFVAHTLLGLAEHILPRRWTNHGAPAGLKKRGEYVALSFLDPIAWVGVGFLLLILFGDGIGVFVTWSGLCLTCRCGMDRFFARMEVLDLIDRRIEAKHKQDLLSGKIEPSQAAGYVHHAQLFTPAAAKTLDEAIAGLDPRLKSVIA